MQTDVYSDRKQISGCLGTEVEEGKTSKGYEESFEGDGYVHFLNCGDGFTCVHMSRLIKLYTLHVPQLYLHQFCVLLYVHQVYLNKVIIIAVIIIINNLSTEENGLMGGLPEKGDEIVLLGSEKLSHQLDLREHIE